MRSARRSSTPRPAALAACRHSGVTGFSAFGQNQGKQSRGLKPPDCFPWYGNRNSCQLSQPSTTLWWASTHFLAAASGVIPPWISVATEFWSSLVQVNPLASFAAGEPLSSSFLEMILLSLYVG